MGVAAFNTMFMCVSVCRSGCEGVGVCRCNCVGVSRCVGGATLFD